MANYKKESLLSKMISNSLKCSFDYKEDFRLYSFLYKFKPNFCNRNLEKDFLGSFLGKTLLIDHKIVNTVSLDAINENELSHTELKLKVIDYPSSLPILNQNNHIIVHIVDLSAEILSFNTQEIEFANNNINFSQNMPFMIVNKDNQPIIDTIFTIKNINNNIIEVFNTLPAFEEELYIRPVNYYSLIENIPSSYTTRSFEASVKQIKI